MNMRAAINAKCKDCIYDPLDEGRWTDQVERCTVINCPLYAFRPVRGGSADLLAKRKAGLSKKGNPEALRRYREEKT